MGRGCSGGSPVDANYRDLIERVSVLQPPMHIFGGVAEDVLLDGSLDRPPGDLDVVVRRMELAERVEQARTLGFVSLEVYYEPLPGRPLVMGGTSDGLRLEFGIIDEDTSGFYFVAGTPDGRLQRIELTDELFTHPSVEIDGTAVHVVSPLALYQMRDAFIRLGTFGASREKDVTVQARIREQLLEEDDPDVLAPAMSPFTPLEPT